MAVRGGEGRNARVKAAVGREVSKLTGAGFRAMLAARPQVREATEAAVAERAQMNSFIESRKASYASGRSLFRHRQLHHEGGAGRGDRRAADRRESVRRLRQLRKGVDRKSTRLNTSP